MIATQPSLLRRLKDARNAEAWEQFIEIYTPFVYGFCRSRGLQEADAADVAQEVMTSVAQALPKFDYDPQKGKFRGWLLTVVRSKFNNFLAQQRRQPRPASTSALQMMIEQETGCNDAAVWENEYYRWIFHWAAERIRGEFSESTWRAFWLTGVEERDGKEVADILGLSVGAVYVAKSRVLSRLKETIHSVDEDGLTPADLGRRLNI